MSTTKKNASINRRRFLGQAAGVASLPLILPASARGANSRVALGVLGTGKRGIMVMKSFLGVEGVEAAALCDVRAAQREQAAAAVEETSGKKGCKTYGDFREVLARGDIDALYIAPQDHWHGVMAVAAAKSGKDMYCEKPLGVCVRESQAIRAAVRRYGVIFQTGTQQRSDQRFRLACELARNGYLGKVHTVKVAAPGPHYQRTYKKPPTPEPVPEGLDYDMYVGPAEMKPYNGGRLAWPDWYLIWDYCAGFVVNWGVHHLDIAHWGCPELAKNPFTLTCKADYRDDGLCDNINAWQAEFEYPNGLRLLFSDTGHPYEQGCRFEGDKGWVHVNRKEIKAEPASLLKTSMKPSERLYESKHHQADFIESLKTRRDPVAPVEAGHFASMFGLLAEIAGRTGRKLEWDPKAERFVNDEDANRQMTRPLRSPWTL